MEKHKWQTEEDGVDMLYLAKHFGGRWTIIRQPQTAGRGDDKVPWEDLPQPYSLELLEHLREILFNKYQRKRCPWKLIEKLDKTIAERREEA